MYCVVHKYERLYSMDPPAVFSSHRPSYLAIVQVLSDDPSRNAGL